MAMKLNAKERTETRRSDLRAMRKSGSIPGVVYGKDMDSKPLYVSEKELIQLLRDDPNAVIQMDVPDAGTKSVMIGSVQRDIIRRNILHVDFREVNLKENVTASVRLEWTGTPKGVKQGGVLQTELRELEVECLPNRIPQQVEVDISGMEIGDALLVKDIPLPDDVAAVTDGEVTAVTVLPPQKEEPAAGSEDEGAPAAESSEQG